MKKTKKDLDLALVIGHIMRWGVMVSISLTVIGGVLFLFRHEGEAVSYSVYVEQDHDIRDILKTMVNELLQFKGRAIILLGILLLFSTPVIRVVFSLIDFMYQHDKIYVVVTLIVLFILYLSLTGGLVH